MMRRGIGALLCWLACLGMASAQETAAHKLQAIANALKFEITTETPTVQAGHPVILKFTVTNVSQEDTYASNEPLVWTVMLEDGTPARDTAEGLRVKRSFINRPSTLDVQPLLKAGASLSRQETVSDLYDMNQPGGYLVSTTQTLAFWKDRAVIKSNTLRITIK